MIWGSSFDTGSTPYGDGTSVAKTVRGAADSGGLAIDMSILHGLSFEVRGCDRTGTRMRSGSY
jgi:hypothetical protein